jgi:hypothetical protein
MSINNTYNNEPLSQPFRSDFCFEAFLTMTMVAAVTVLHADADVLEEHAASIFRPCHLLRWRHMFLQKVNIQLQDCMAPQSR